MCSTDGGQYQHASQEQHAAVSGQDERESHAEEQGEDGVELSVNQQIEQEVYAPVGTLKWEGCLLLRREECPECELWEVGQRNT